ncbi:hypothetical protein GCM10027048_34870 [Hymenobacter coalescens]
MQHLDASFSTATSTAQVDAASSLFILELEERLEFSTVEVAVIKCLDPTQTPPVC